MSDVDNCDLSEDEGAGYLVSVSDIMAGLLFIFMLTLMAFVINYQNAASLTEEQRQRLVQELAALKVKQQELEHEKALLNKEKIALQQRLDALSDARDLRTEMLTSIQSDLKRLGLEVSIDEQHGILRLSENAILFRSGRTDLGAQERSKLSRLAEVLAEILPCYTNNPPEACPQHQAGKLEAVFLEGHTDNVPIHSARVQDNWELSTQRAIYTFRQLIDARPILMELRNRDGQPLFSVSGYGSGRPVPGHAHQTPSDDSANRRIDLRFIMTPPRSDLSVINDVRAKGFQ
jgi:flagellar motor protein MotB